MEDAAAAAQAALAAAGAQIDDVRRKITSLKGRVTKAANRAQAAATAARQRPRSATADAAMLRDLEASCDKIRELDLKIGDKYDEMADIAVDAGVDIDGIESERDATNADVSSKQASVLTAITESEAAMSAHKAMEARTLAAAATPTTPALPPNTAGSAHADSGRTPHSVKLPDFTPSKLSAKANPTQFKIWRAGFKVFFTTSKGETFPLDAQRQLLFNNIDDTLSSFLDITAPEDTPMFDSTATAVSYYDLLTQRFEEDHPLFTRRSDFFDCRQQPSQDWDAFWTLLNKLADMAELEKLTPTQLRVQLAIAGTIDVELKREFLKLKEPTVSDMRATLAMWKKLHKGAKSDVPAIREVKAYKHRRSHAPRDKPRDLPVCTACGRPHPVAGPCRAAAATCSFCHMVGHFHWGPGRVLLCSEARKESKNKSANPKGKYQAAARQIKYQDSDDSASDSEGSTLPPAMIHAIRVRSARAHGVLARATPKAIIRLYDKPSRKAIEMAVTPDTGAEVNCIAYDVVQDAGFHIKGADIELAACNTTPISCDGVVDLKLTYGNMSYKTSAIVSKALSQDFLLSYVTCLELNIIAPCFPLQIGSFGPAPGPWAADTPKVCQITANPALDYGPDPFISPFAGRGEVNEREPNIYPHDSKESILRDFRDVFVDELSPDDGPMNCPPAKIVLKNDPSIRPEQAATARAIPIHQRPGAKQLMSSLRKGRKPIIEPVDKPTKWTSRAHFVPKSKPGAVRLVNDFRRLNLAVHRPFHPARSVPDLIKMINPLATSFAKVDAVHGFFQIPLDADSADLTTFITEEGRFRYNRMPMGISNAGEEFGLKTDPHFTDIADLLKIVDDMMVQGMCENQTCYRVRIVAQRARKLNLKLSREKFQLGPEVKFAGHVISAAGVRPDPDRISAVRDFPAPKCVSDVRSALGLFNQLAMFHPDLAQATPLLRSLLKKETAFHWSPAHQSEFEITKQLLTSDAVVFPFDPALPTTVFTDASRLGLGYVLMQTDTASGQQRLVHCGSCSLTPAQRNYAVIELEAIAVQWAIQKCRFFLLGAPMFHVKTDHKPLVGVFAKNIVETDNPRLLRVREKTSPYTFTVSWIQGKENVIADALSRQPVFGPDQDLNCGPAIRSVTATISAMGASPNVATMRELARADDDYTAVVDAIATNAIPESAFARSLTSVWPRLSADDGLLVIDGHRLVPPPAARSELLALLHGGHPGIQKALRNASQTVFWPGLRNELMQQVASCAACQSVRPSLPAEPEIVTTAEFPMQKLGADMFSFAGHEFVLFVDRFSGYPFVKRLKTTSAAKSTAFLASICAMFGFPESIRADGGPQFRGEFEAFCEGRGIHLETSAPYHPESNGLAEVSVREVKRLMKKCHHTGEDFDEQLLAWRCLPLAAGASPAQAFLGRRPRTTLPALATPAPNLDAFRARRQAQAAAHVHAKRPRLPLPPVGAQVLVQDPKTRRWVEQGIIVEHHSERSAIIQFENGRRARRNRRHIKHFEPEAPAPLAAEPPNRLVQPRLPPLPAPQRARPQRQRCAPDRLNL